MLYSDEFYGKSLVVQPLDAAPALDALMAIGERDAEGDNIARVELVHAAGGNVRPPKADVLDAAVVGSFLVGEKDICGILLSFMIAIERGILGHKI
jgi:hypothetical protein